MSMVALIKLLVYTVLLIHVVLFLGADGAGQVEYYALVEELFGDYNKNVRPTTNGEGTIVRINMNLKSVVDLDEKNQILSAYGTLDIIWEDDYLMWNFTDYGNISRILYPQKQLWLPDIIHENSVESQVQLGYDQLMCSIGSDGEVTWQPSEIFKTSCDIDVTYYPFDTQECSIIFTTMMSNVEEIDIDPFQLDGDVGLQNYQESSTWQLVDTSIEAPEYNDNFTRIKFILKLKRLRLYYIVNILLPVLLLSLTSSMLFYLPAESGEKVGMGITVLLSYTVYLTIIADKMPETSQQISILGVYITILLTLSSLSVMLSVLVLNIHHRDLEIPISKNVEQRTRIWRKMIGLGPPQFRTNRNQIEPIVKADDDQNGLRMRKTPNSNHHLQDTLKMEMAKFSSNNNKGSYEIDACEGEKEDITWVKVAQTLDRVLFIIFTSAVIGVTVILIPLMIILSEILY